jgi:hypothetical protein
MIVKNLKVSLVIFYRNSLLFVRAWRTNFLIKQCISHDKSTRLYWKTPPNRKNRLTNQWQTQINKVFSVYNMYVRIEELDGPAVSAFGVRSRKLSNLSKGRPLGDQNLLSQAPCFGRNVKSLVPAAFAVVSTHSIPKEGWRPVVKNNCRIFITTWWKTEYYYIK